MKKKKTSNRNRGLALGLIVALILGMNGNLLGEVHAAEYKAAIGAVNYQTLDEAVAAVTEGQTIRLLSPVEITPGGETGIINRPGVAFYLDLGNQSVSGNQEGALIQVKSGNPTVYNGQILNSHTAGSAISATPHSTAKISYPIGFQNPDPSGGMLDLPAAYHLEFSNSANGTIRYGSTNGPQVPLSEGNLYSGENVAFDFYFVPDVGYKVDTFTINSAIQPVAASYHVSSLTQDQTIGVSFKKITFTVTPKAYANDKVAKLGVFLTPGSATVEYGGSQTFSYTVRTGFRLIDVTVNGVSIGPVTTFQVKNVTSPQNIKIMLEKTALFIMLDAGHYAYYNHSPVLSTYYEGNTMWTYHKYLEQTLEQYPNIIVDTTRPDNSRAIGSALGPWERGAMGEGYDLVLSVHSNAASTSTADHPVAICTLDPRYTAVSKALGLKLANKVAEVMKTTEAAKAYVKAQSDGQDWYGVNRGATSVGVPSVILEHSFHTNYRATVWLTQDANLRALAVAEAKVIADFYGIAAEEVVMPPATPTGSIAYSKSYDTLAVRWNLMPEATGYEIFRSTTPTTGFTKIGTTATYYYYNTGLISGKTYYYKVRAIRTVGTKTAYSGFTPTVSAIPHPAVPTVGVTPGVDKATISWGAVAGAHGYQILRATGTTGTYVKVKTITNATTFKWTNYGLATGKVYSYKVRAYRVMNGVIVYGSSSSPKSVKIL